jgi:hypothetical protein
VTVSAIDDEPRSKSMNRRSEHFLTTMRSATLSHPSSNHSPVDHQHQQKQQVSNDEEKSTYSFRYVTKKLQHAKSHGELYQPHAPLPLPPMTNMNNDENEIEYRKINSSESPRSSTSMRVRSATTTVVPIITRPTINSYDETFNSTSSNKIPLWKRFKRLVVPTKRNKEKQNSTIRIPSLQINDLTINGIRKTFF